VIRALIRDLVTAHRRYMAKHALASAAHRLASIRLAKAGAIRHGVATELSISDLAEAELLAVHDLNRAARRLRTLNTTPATAANEMENA
jgi:fructose-specific phosphotransferase system component IIB